MDNKEILLNPRVIVVQKLFSNHFNEDAKLDFSKHRYKKFIKDVVQGTIERKDLINDLLSDGASKVRIQAKDMILSLRESIGIQKIS